MVSLSFSNMYNQAKQNLIDKNYKDIYRHELAHKQAGGSLAGSIVIERNQDGIPVGGHVGIQVPSLNKKDPQKTIDQANIVIKSAMAPSDPSGQDYKVAAQAKGIKAKAQDYKQSHHIDYYA